MVSVASSGRYLFIKYDDHWASNSLGFNITYQLHERQQCGCGGDYELGSPTGTLLSHKDFDSSDGMLVRQRYLPWSRCQWLIRLPVTALITLRFDHFDVRGKSSGGLCYGDMLVLHDGSSNHTIGQTFCKNYQDTFSITSTSSSLGVRFLTGPMERMDSRGTGFILTYFATCPNAPRVPGTNMTFVDNNSDGPDVVTYGESILFTCQPGYNMGGGDVIRTCRGDGTFSGSDLQCLPVRCHDIPNIPHTGVYYTDVNLDGDIVVSFSEIVMYECTMGYVLKSGDQERRCKLDGTLTGTDVVCEALLCLDIPTFPHSTHTSLHNENLTYLHQVEYICNHGYQIRGGDSVRMCQADGNLSGQDIVCKPMVCQSVPQIPHTYKVSRDVNRDGEDMVSFGESVVYRCQNGYLSSTDGNENRFCMADGRLNGTDISCFARRCLEVPAPPFSKFSTVDTSGDGDDVISYGEFVEYACTEGYYRTHGDVKRYCGSNGILDGLDLSCSPRLCDAIPFPENTQYVTEDSNGDGQETMTYTEAVYYVCKNGFLPMGGDLKRVCQDDGQFNGTDLICLAVNCGQPPSIDNSVVIVSNTSFGSVAHYFCKAGYQSQGRDVFSSECSSSGDWTGEIANCSETPCPPLPDIPNAISTPILNRSKVPWGSSANITCLKGFNMEHVTQGVITWKCLKDGSWEGMEVMCKPTDNRRSESTESSDFDWIIFVVAVVCATVFIVVTVAIISFCLDKKRRESTKMRRLRREYESSSASSPPLSSRGAPSCLSDRNLLAGGLPLAYPGGMFVSEASREMYEDYRTWYKMHDSSRADHGEVASAHACDGRNDSRDASLHAYSIKKRIEEWNKWNKAFANEIHVTLPCDTSNDTIMDSAISWDIERNSESGPFDFMPSNDMQSENVETTAKPCGEENMRPEEEIIIYEEMAQF